MRKTYEDQVPGEEDCTSHRLAQGLSLSPASSQGLFLPSPTCSAPVQPEKEFVLLLSFVFALVSFWPNPAQPHAQLWGIDPLSTQGLVAALCSELLCSVCATCSATEMCSGLHLLYSL